MHVNMDAILQESCLNLSLSSTNGRGYNVSRMDLVSYMGC